MTLSGKLLVFFLACASALAQTHSVKGHVYADDGRPARGARVTIANGTSRFTSITNEKTGEYVISGVSPGQHTVAAEAKGYGTDGPRTITISGDQTIDFVVTDGCDVHGCPKPMNHGFRGEGGWTILSAVIFMLSVWSVRWFNIAQPNRQRLTAEIQNIRARFHSETGLPLIHPDAVHIGTLLDQAEAAIRTNWKTVPKEFFYWSLGSEISAWVRLHEARRLTLNLLAASPPPAEIVHARLQALELDLADIDKTHAKTLASRIKAALEAQNTTNTALLALLIQALTYFDDEIDNSYSQLVSWQTKAVWLTASGAAVIVTLTFMVGNATLFLVGAVGGYLSRLSRSLKRADVPTDYGASWTTLFLSPIAGALSGWFGILLIVLLADSRFNVLGDAFRAVNWCAAMAPITMALAFVFGFSERLFDGIVSSLEDKVDRDRAAATKPQQPPSQTPPAGGNPAEGGGGAAASAQARREPAVTPPPALEAAPGGPQPNPPAK